MLRKHVRRSREALVENSNVFLAIPLVSKAFQIFRIAFVTFFYVFNKNLIFQILSLMCGPEW